MASKKRVFKIILIACSLILGTLIFITAQAISETENWKWFDLDFNNRENVISGYSALLASILSSLSIILLVYTIYLQNRESRKQAKRFKKEIQLQEEQFQEEKDESVKKEQKYLLTQLKIVSVFLDSIIKYVEETGIELKDFIEREKESPISMNMLFFTVNKTMGKLIEMDYVSIFSGFEKFLGEENDWVKQYVRLFNVVGFYNDAIEELRSNFKYHNDNKFQRKDKISLDLKKLLDDASKLIDNYKNHYENYLEHPFAKLINNFTPTYYEIIDADNKEQKETDLEKLSHGLLYDFLKQAFEIRNEIGFDQFGILEMVSSISSIRKDIYRLKFDCEYFAENGQNRYDSYFDPRSDSFQKLVKLKAFIDIKLDNVEN